MSDIRNLRQATIAGGAAGDLTLTGVKVGDKLLTIVNVAAAGANLAGEFTITAANTINNAGGTNTTGMVLLVTWEEIAGGKYNDRISDDKGRYPY